MDSNAKQTRPGVSGVFQLVPAGVPLKQRKYISARFPQGPPGFSSQTKKEELLLGIDPQNAAAPRQREGGPATAQPPPALLLINKSQQATPATKQLQGVPRLDPSTSNYFVLMRAGRNFSVYPLDATYTFKTHVRPSSLTIEEVEAAQRAPAAAAAAAAAADAALLLPKSVRQQMQEEAATQAADRKLKEDVLPILKDKVEELSVKYSNNDNKLVLHASDNEEESEEDMDFGGGEEDAGPKKGRKGKSEAGETAKGRKGKAATGQPDEPEIPEDELAEDIYAGEEDELRPVNPRGEDADWEFNEEAADDDLAQGASDEEGLDDDPGYRKELGLEGDDEEDEEEKKKKEEELEQEAQKAAAAAPPAAQPEAAAADAKPPAAEEDNIESMDMEDEDLLMADDDDFDVDDLDRLAAETEGGDPSQALKRRKQASGRYKSPAPGTVRSATPPVRGGRDSTPVGAKRGATPPLSAMAAGAAAAASGRGATPPPGAVSGRATPPPGAGSKAAAAAAAGRRGTPPLQGNGAKRKRDGAAGGSEGGSLGSAALGGTAAAAAAGVAAAGGSIQAAWNWSPDQLDAQGVPTTDGIIQALRAMGPIPTENLGLLQERLALGAMSADGKGLLKRRLLQVAKVEKDAAGRKYMVLK